MPAVGVVGDVGAAINVDRTFQVANTDALTASTKVLLTQESFDLEISAENLTVSALDIDVSLISLSTKTVTFKGMNSLKNGVGIDSFDLPSNHPSGGITLNINCTVTNPSQVGIALSALQLQVFFAQTNLGPAGAGKPFVLAPTQLPFTGRLVQQTSDSGLAELLTVFNNFIHGKDSNVTVHARKPFVLTSIIAIGKNQLTCSNLEYVKLGPIWLDLFSVPPKLHQQSRRLCLE
jgi:hypothetical protein